MDKYLNKLINNKSRAYSVKMGITVLNVKETETIKSK